MLVHKGAYIQEDIFVSILAFPFLDFLVFLFGVNGLQDADIK